MNGYSITFARSARKELQAIDPTATRRILGKIETLADDPRPPSCRKLRGAADLWRIRVGQYRVVYRVDDSDHLVHVVVVRHRRDVYR